MPLLPHTDGTLKLYQGRDWMFSVSVIDEATKAPQVASGYVLAMQVRATIGSDEVLIDCATYATSDPAVLTAAIVVPAGITGAIGITADFADWIADAKFVKTGSDPESSIDAGRFTVQVYRQVTR